jgi:hypothetical protein
MQVTIGCDPEHNQATLQSTGPCREVKCCALDSIIAIEENCPFYLRPTLVVACVDLISVILKLSPCDSPGDSGSIHGADF